MFSATSPGDPRSTRSHSPLLSALCCALLWSSASWSTVGLLGCLPQDDNEAAAYDDGVAEPPPSAPGCSIDADCQLAAASCCECPSYAVSASDRAEDACSGVICEGEMTCPAVDAVCERGACVMQCQPIACDLTCASGFAVDEAGCLTCWCAPEPPGFERECTAAEDCVRVPADCCGCARGGNDTAVPGELAEVHLAGLDCPESPACPEVEACEEGLQAGCVAGTCTLLIEPADGPPDGPPDGTSSDQWCGSPELPACPDGSVCVLNATSANDATVAGVGICQSA